MQAWCECRLVLIMRMRCLEFRVIFRPGRRLRKALVEVKYIIILRVDYEKTDRGSTWINDELFS